MRTQPSFSRAVRTLTVVSAFALAAAPGLAQAGEAESRTLFADGRQLRQSGKCAEAIPVFRRALESYPEGLGSLRNIAECEEEIGRFASARRDWWDLRLAVRQSAQSRYENWEKEAEEAHKRLESRVARVVIKVNGPANAQVYVNGRPLDPRLIGTELEMDLGTTEFTLRDGTASPPTKKLDLGEGQKHTVELESHADPGNTSSPTGQPGGTGGSTSGTGATPIDKNPKTPPPVEEESGSGLLVGGVVALSIAGAAAVGFGVSLGVRQSALSDLEEVCPDVDASRCAATGEDRNVAEDAMSKGKTTSTLATVFAIGGGVAAGAGIGLLIASAMQGGKADVKQNDAVTFNVVPDVGGGHLLLHGRF